MQIENDEPDAHSPVRDHLNGVPQVWIVGLEGEIEIVRGVSEPHVITLPEPYLRQEPPVAVNEQPRWLLAVLRRLRKV